MLKSWKALVEKQSDIDPEVFASLIEAAEGKEVQSDGDKSKAPKHTITEPKEGSADAAVYHAILGSAYDVMRTAGINDYDEDINERYTQLAEEHLEKALANKQVLADTPADDYYPLMEKGKDSYLYDNSMLQVIMDFAVETIFWGTNIYQHLKECADLYKERGNLNAYALCMHQLIIRQIDNDDKEIRISRTEADRRIKSLFEEVKNEEVGCDIALFVYNSYNSDDEKLAFIRWALAQYPNHKLINEFKNEEAEILRATCTIKTDDHIIANQPFNVKAITTNMTELTIQVRQYDGRDKNNRLKETGSIVQEYKFPVAQDPKHSHTELHTAQMIRAIQLGNEIGSLDDGACHQLGKEGHIEPEIEDVAHRFHKSPVNIGRITDHLERIEGDSHGKDDSIHTPELALGEKVSHLSGDVGHLEVRAKQVIYHIGEEITVLEIAQNGQIYKDTQYQKSLALPLPVVSETVDEPRYRVVGAGDENEQSHKKSARLIIEKEADKEEIGILQRTKRHDRATYVLLPLGGERHKQGEATEHKGEEYPELQLGEKQRAMRVEGKDTLDIGYQTRHNVDFFLLEVM